MAQRTGLSQTAIVRIWRAFDLPPHRVENFKFSKDPQFVEKVQGHRRAVYESTGARDGAVRG